jgi:hypothetical protein
VFYPALLPARSWQKIMAEQDRHFGTDLGLDASTSAAVLAFMTANSADQHSTEAAFKIDNRSPRLYPFASPNLPYWLLRPRCRRSGWRFSEAQSNAPPATAMPTGYFEDAAMQIPGRR